VNFVKYNCFFALIPNNQSIFRHFLIVLLSIYIAGCSDGIRQPSVEQLTEFEDAGPIHPTIDLDRLEKAKIGKMSYRFVPGDVLEVSISPALQVSTTELPGFPGQDTPYICRVSDNGAIRLPVVGEIEVTGKTVAEIESAIIDACYPKYCANRPSVFVRGVEYKMAKVSIIGAVENPGIYELRSDQMSLVELLTKAGGIVDEGAARIRIIHSDEATADNKPVDEKRFEQLAKSNGSASQEENLVDYHIRRLLKTINSDHTAEIADVTDSAGEATERKPLVIPVKDLDIPFANVVLRDGDAVEVERLEQPLFTVIGLVNQPGNFPYPSDVQYNLIQAVGFAGGFNQAAEPRYATVYRIKADGTITGVTFKVVDTSGASKLTNASNVLIKPGDIIALEHTPRTRTNLFLNSIFRIQVGAYVPVWDND